MGNVLVFLDVDGFLGEKDAVPIGANLGITDKGKRKQIVGRDGSFGHGERLPCHVASLWLRGLGMYAVPMLPDLMGNDRKPNNQQAYRPEHGGT